MPLSEMQKSRYARQLALPEVGEEGQAELLEAKVLLVGVGGLGSPAATYLAAAGVGTIGLVDADIVEVSNLHRQVIHSTHRVGLPKVESAALAITALNPDVRVIKHPQRMTKENASDILSGYDIALDCVDNFTSRYALNDAAHTLDRPVVHAAISRFTGQVTVFRPAQGHCYRCLAPERDEPEKPASEVSKGVLGVLPGLIGLIQATEAIKLILGLGGTLERRLLCYNALDMEFKEFSITTDPDCDYH